MTDPTPTTTPTPPEGLTDEQLLELMPEQFRADLATASRLAAQDAGPDTKPGVFRVILNTGALAYARAVIAADRAARPIPAPVPLTPAQLEKLQEVLTDHWDEGPPGEGWASSELDKLRAIIDTWHAQPTPAPAPTPEELEAQFRAWWKASYPNAPAGGHAVRSHVAFALHLLGRGAPTP
jgi:hypothetical protein